MNPISAILNNKKSKCALIPFITAGYPSLKKSVQALFTLDNQGADIIELGIPYSDALADGPIIQESSKVALEQGIYIDQVLNILEAVQFKLKAPIVIFTYYNPVLSRGVKRFIQEIVSSGAQGLLIPDLPVEETDYIISLCTYYKIELILFIAPTSSEKRIELILLKSPGCIYLVSSCGVTGLRKELNSEIKNLVNIIKYRTNKLVILGFGISNSVQANLVSKYNIDGIVIGSAFIKTISSSEHDDINDNLGSFCSKMKLSINS
uniref:Tryptophan synthase alpha chain n=1 Tax=Gastroclonium compressum TaxID=1852973 RepID=A0A173FZW0_GASCM|nr:tryptophane synthase alpha subunit [Coeloseira compressa]ANH09564.1 tryptophane synthase alpha subunit [Coeloseira compressa]